MLTRKIISLVLFVSLLALSVPTNARSEGSLPVLVGLYPSSLISQTVGEINALESYMGKPTISIAGTFLDLENPASLIQDELNASWDNGYVPFVNLAAGSAGTPRSAQEIANGAIDGAIRNWAQTFKAWSQGGDKRAFIAPLQEMNGFWVSYHGDPQNYIRAYVRIRQIFLDEGVSPSSVSWVFAPNGWHDPYTGYPFEAYYPGDSVVDVVGFSSFNHGNCWTFTHSQPYEELYKPYMDRMAAMAPGKPIFIAEIGAAPNGLDRDAWINDTLSKIGAYPGLRAILYFNRSEIADNYILANDLLCPVVDFSLDASDIDENRHNETFEEGKAAFRFQVTKPPYGYWAPDSAEMMNIAFSRPSATFEDVWPASAFSGKSTTPYYQPWVERLVSAGITAGCSSQVIDFNGVSDFTFRYYCPEDSVTRAQMAVFLERGIHGLSFTPPSVAPTFNDTAGHWAQNWIEALRNDGITAGCATGLYCPENPVTRAQMAVFLLKSKNGSSYAPPASGSDTGFSDVLTTYWAAAWIKQLALDGITGGCGAGIYCPENPVTRGQMAIFLVKTFNLP